VERAFKTLTRTVFFIVLENDVRHKSSFSLQKPLLYTQTHLLSTYYLSITFW
jgi:hypothetical protein